MQPALWDYHGVDYLEFQFHYPDLTFTLPQLIVITGPKIGDKPVTFTLPTLKTVILSCDSADVSRNVNCTAVPTSAELTEIKHYFIGNLSLLIIRFFVTKKKRSAAQHAFPEASYRYPVRWIRNSIKMLLIHGWTISRPDPAIRAELNHDRYPKP